MRSILGPGLRVTSLVIALGLVATGCNDCCSGDECIEPAPDAGPDDTGASLAFVNIPASIDCFDDRDPAEPGEQIDVEVRLTDGEGEGFGTVTFSVGDVEVTSAIEGSGLATGRVTLTGGPAPGVANTVVAKAGNGTETLSVSAQVLDTCVPPDPPAPACTFVAPLEDDTLTTSTAPVEVECSGGDPNDPAEQALLGAGVVLVTVLVDDETPTIAEVQLVDGSGAGTLILPQGEGVTAILDLSLIGAQDLFGEALTASISVTLDNVPPPPPACSFAAPLDGAILAASPATVEVACTGGDPDVAAEQALLTAGVVRVDVVVDTTTVATTDVQLAGGTGTGSLDLPFADDTAATLTLTLVDDEAVFDAAVEDTLDVTLDVSPPPACTFIAPTEGATITTTTTPVEVTCTGGDPDDAAQQTLLTTGTVRVTMTVDGQTPTTVDVQLASGAGAGTIDVPPFDDATAVVDLALVGAEAVFGAPVTSSLGVTLDLAPPP